MKAQVSIIIADSVVIWAARLTRIALLPCVMSSPHTDRDIVPVLAHGLIYAAVQYKMFFLGQDFE